VASTGSDKEIEKLRCIVLWRESHAQTCAADGADMEKTNQPRTPDEMVLLLVRGDWLLLQQTMKICLDRIERGDLDPLADSDLASLQQYRDALSFLFRGIKYTYEGTFGEPPKL
jgi:hypothetical protein